MKKLKEILKEKKIFTHWTIEEIKTLLDDENTPPQLKSKLKLEYIKRERMRKLKELGI